MTNRGTRVKSGKKTRLRYLSLAFSETNSNTKENLENGKRPHGGIKGEKKHPLSPYSYNREPQYHQDIQDDIDKLFREEFIENHGSPDWVVEANKDVTHTDESPLLVNKLLSPSKQAKNDDLYLENLGRLSGRRSAPPSRKSETTTFYRPNSTHQYLTTTETRDSTESGYDIRYGRPTRTTLLRARQRSNSTPINAYEARREAIKRMESPSPSYSEVINVSNPRESRHSFLTGARYNRAHYLDAKSLSVYGVYMPRNNPHACFMTGHPTSRIKDGIEIPAAPPDSPRSDTEDLSLPLHLKRPATAPGKRLLIASTPPSGRPRSAWGDVTTTCNITQNESENNENTELSNNKPVIEELIVIPDDLNIRGSKVIVTIKGSKSLSLSESKLPRVMGISVPRLTHNSARDAVDETSLVNQPPPTPVGDLSVNGEHEEQQSVSLSVKLNSLRNELENENLKENYQGAAAKTEETGETTEQNQEAKMEDEPVEKENTVSKQENKNSDENVHTAEKRVNWNYETMGPNNDNENGNNVPREVKDTTSGTTFFITEEENAQNPEATLNFEKYSEPKHGQMSSLKQIKGDLVEKEDVTDDVLNENKNGELEIDHSITVSIEEKLKET